MSDGAMSDSATACEAALVRSYTPTEWHDARKCGYCCAFRDGWDDAVGGVSARPGDIDLDLMRPTAADYAAALAQVDDMRAAGSRIAAWETLAAALAFVRARLAADVAMERYIERGRDTKAGVVTTDTATWAALDAECGRADEAAIDAWHAFVALAANADVAP